MAVRKMPTFLCVGLCCVDNVYEVSNLVEDSDQRCLSHCMQKGGNASNNCTVLGILNAHPTFLGVIANSPNRRFIEDEFKKYGVDILPAVIVDGFENGESCVIISHSRGTRTIIHDNKRLPEVSFQRFMDINVTQFSWIHFEGRNEAEVIKMMRFIQNVNQSSRDEEVTVSVEIEKANIGLEDLIPLANVVFVSKDFARMKGCEDMDQTISKLSGQIAPHATLICPWGVEGALAYKDGVIYRSSSYPPNRVVDTLGAGDTFIASTIYALAIGESIESSLEFGCKVAGAKVGCQGWEKFELLMNGLDYVSDMKRKFCSTHKLS